MGGGGACVCWLCVCDGVPLASLLRTHRPTHPPTNHTTHPLQLEWEQQQAAAAAHLAQYAGGQYWGGGGGARRRGAVAAGARGGGGGGGGADAPLQLAFAPCFRQGALLAVRGRDHVAVLPLFFA